MSDICIYRYHIGCMDVCDGIDIYIFPSLFRVYVYV